MKKYSIDYYKADVLRLELYVVAKNYTEARLFLKESAKKDGIVLPRNFTIAKLTI